MALRSILGSRTAALARLSALALLLVACDKQDEIIVRNVIPDPANQPPIIVEQGPLVPPEGRVIVSDYYSIGLDLWVLVGDPNGLDDISLVTVGVDSVRLRRYVLRPDTSSGSCTQFSYAPNETISTTQILTVPRIYPGFSLKPLTLSQGGLYIAAGFGGYGFGLPDLMGTASNLKPWPGGCGNTNGLLWPVVVQPPAVPSPTAAILTLMEVEYLGIKVTVYDKVGASATTGFPDWHLTYVTQEEIAALP